MSPEAARIITPEALEFATGHPPITQLTGNVEHVTFLGPGEGRADLLLIAPATANTLSKIAQGIDDTPVTSFASIALGGGVPVLLAPAMHAHMALNPAVRENIERLRSWGVGLVTGASAEGEEKIAAPEEVAAAVLHRLGSGPWAGRSVVVIGGAAQERVDAVRTLTNESSGATAVALATQAHYRGANVQLWLGGVRVVVPSWIAQARWDTVESLLLLARARGRELAGAAAVFVPAALSDFTLDPHPGKIPSRAHATLSLALRRAPKVLPELRALAPPPTRLVGFKLEAGESADELEQEGRRLREETGADWIIANDVAVMGAESTSVLVLGSGKKGHWIRGAKSEVAGKLLDDLGRDLANLGSGSGPAAPAPAPTAPPAAPAHRARPVRRRRPARDRPRRS
jgi:phosphopantothenoylcysteine decarboxylase / phosphopantothenate---cysteine ligase